MLVSSSLLFQDKQDLFFHFIPGHFADKNALDDAVSVNEVRMRQACNQINLTYFAITVQQNGNRKNKEMFITLFLMAAPIWLFCYH